MKGEARISGQQLACLVGITSHVATLLYLPSHLARIAGPDAWLAILLGALGGGVPVALLLGLLARTHPRRTFAEMAEAALGRWAGKAATLLFVLFSLLLGALVMRNVMDFAAIVILPGTPPWALGGLLAATAGFLAWNGAEVIARLGVLVLIAIALSAGATPIAVAGRLNALRVLPPLGAGLFPLLQATWISMGWFAEIVVFGAFVGLVDRPHRAGRNLLWGLAIGTGILVVLTIPALMSMGHQLMGLLNYPIYSLIQLIHFGEFLERLEISLITVWLSGMLVETGTILWAASGSVAQMLELRSERYAVPPVAAVALVLTFLLPGSPILIHYLIWHWTAIALPVAIGLPALLLAAGWLRAGLRGRRTA